MSLLEVIRDKPAPYVATVLIAACGWTVTHAIDILSKAPIVEYSVELIGHEQHSVVKIGWTNLSYANQFGEMTFILKSANKDEEFKYRPLTDSFECVSPGFKSGTPPDTRSGSSAIFVLRNFQPGIHCWASVAYTGQDLPTLMLSQSKDTVRLMQRSLFTWLIRNRIEVLGVAAILALALAITLIARSFDTGYCKKETIRGGNSRCHG